MTRRTKTIGRQILDQAGVLNAIRSVRRAIWLRTDEDLRQLSFERTEAFPAFEQRHGAVLRHRLGPRSDRVALVVSHQAPTPEVGLLLIKGLEMAGYRPVVLVDSNQDALRPYLALSGAVTRPWEDFSTGARTQRAAARLVEGAGSIEALLAYEAHGIRIGRLAVQTALKRERRGSFDLASRDDRDILIERAATSLSAASVAERVCESLKPAFALFLDSEYSPRGELFDACLARGIEVVAFDAVHRPNALMFKRFTRDGRGQHLASLSDASWAHVQALDWTPERREQLDHELTAGYTKGDWYGACWTQAHTQRLTLGEARTRLGLDPGKKTAFVMSHMLFDAPHMWAAPLFLNYEEWLVETVRAACENPAVNWVVKVHPANVGKALRVHYRGEAAEVTALRRLGPLPPHVRMLLPESDVSTISLFSLMDYCLTVRGTPGLEAARLGIPALTAARSRYSHRGFTIDSDTREAYLARLARIQDIPPLSPAERERAERFAYGLFVLRPCEFQSVTWDWGRLGHRRRGLIHLASPDEWSRATDIASWAEWIGRSRDEDYLSKDTARPALTAVGAG